MKKLYRYRTGIGPFYIAWSERDRYYHALFEDETLCHYPSIQQVLDELTGGHSESAGGVDTWTLGISDDISEWEPLVRR